MKPSESDPTAEFVKQETQCQPYFLKVERCCSHRSCCHWQYRCSCCLTCYCHTCPSSCFHAFLSFLLGNLANHALVCAESPSMTRRDDRIEIARTADEFPYAGSDP